MLNIDASARRAILSRHDRPGRPRHGSAQAGMKGMPRVPTPFERGAYPSFPVSFAVTLAAAAV